jgi:hypothetical protein
MNNGAAENSFGICIERGAGVPKNQVLAAHYYWRPVEHGHADGANNFGFCLEHGCGVQQNIEMALDYYRFAADHGYPEAKLNHSHCLRLLDRWEPTARSTEMVYNSPSPGCLSRIFRELFPNPDALTDEGRQFLNSIQQLKSRALMVGIPTLSDPVFPCQIPSGFSSTVKLSLDSKSNLIAVKTAKYQSYTELIRRETAMLKELEHPLVITLRHDISSNSAVVTEFVGNGSLASHFQSQSGLIRAN